MKKRIPQILVFVMIFLNSCAQAQNYDCDKVLDHVPYFFRHSVAAANDSLENDFRILRECGQLDTIDRELVNVPLLAAMMFRMSQDRDQKEITYRSVLKSINEFKETREYSIIRNAKLLEKKTVNMAEWEIDKKILLSGGIPESETEKLRKYILKHSDQKMTFKQAYDGYSASQPKVGSASNSNLQFPELGDFDDAIKSGKTSTKPVLIFFTCYACASSRKMEENILTNGEVKSLLTEHFVIYSAHVDDRRTDPKTGSAIGQKYSKLQSDKFNSSLQPYFVIIDSGGALVASIAYCQKAKDFVAFLKKGIK